MKKVAELHLNDNISIVKKDFVDERINDRVWYEVTEIKIRRLEYDPEQNEIIVNKGLADTAVLQMKEDVYTSPGEAKVLAANMNDRELAEEQKIYKELKRKMEESKKIVDFFEVELKKVGL